MTPEEAIEFAQDKFPLEKYMDFEKRKYLNIANTVLRYLRPGDKILDFGSGPCDKTAVIQALGFQCSAFDDLQDNWHNIDGNREKIIIFAKNFGIDFKLKSDDSLPFEKSSFDMLMMHGVLEHLHDSPRELINDLLEYVKPEGYFFATVPNAVNIRKRIYVLLGKTNYPPFDNYYWYPGPWRGHVREYTKDDFIKLSKYLNLSIVELRTCHYMLKRVHRFILPFYLGISSIVPGWRDTWLLVAKKRPVL